MAGKKLNPGTPTPKSGQYEVVGPRGASKDREITSIRGNPLLPTQNPGEGYRLVDPTKHKGRGQGAAVSRLMAVPPPMRAGGCAWSWSHPDSAGA